MCNSKAITQNVKLHFKFKGKLIIPETNKILIKTCNNFIVVSIIKYKYKYIIFKKAKHVNLTGIKTKYDYFKSLKLFTKYFHKEVFKITSDNITASGTIDCQELSLNKLLHIKEELKKSGGGVLNIRVHAFPAAVIRGVGTRGTIILFLSKKYILVGVTSYREKKDLHRRLCEILQL